MYLCACVCMYVCMHTCMYVCISVLASFKKRQDAWKILHGNLKILGFLPQIFIKTTFRITKMTGHWRKMTGHAEKGQGAAPCHFGLARTLCMFVLSSL